MLFGRPPIVVAGISLFVADFGADSEMMGWWAKTHGGCVM